MRHGTVPLALMLLALCGQAGADSIRSVRAELSGAEAARFAIENLAGAMRVSAGPGDKVVVVATVHGESDPLAAALQFERRSGKTGEPLLRLKYPVAETRSFRYPGAHGTSQLRYSESGELNDHWWGGQRVTVSDHEGTLLYADLEVQVPARELQATFFNRVGPIAASGVRGTLRFESSGGEVTLSHVGGDVVADTGSGDVSVRDGSGTLRCDTGSGGCEIARFDGLRLLLDTGSGALRLSDVKCREIDADTGSGDVLAERLEVDSFRADTGSGDVTLRLPPDASFEMHADTGSGEIVSRFKDAEPIMRRRELVGYRRGDGRVKIELDTGSGDVRLEPLD
jgi:hypothetical protein